MKINTLYTDARSGDTTSEKILFQYLLDRIRYTVHHRIWDKDAAEEIVQDALLVIAREYREIRIETSFAAWVYKVVENRILAYMKEKQLSERRVGKYSSNLNSGSNASEDPTLKRTLLDCLKRLGKTKLRYSRALVLHYQGFSVPEICTKMNLTDNALYLLLSRGRKMLATCIETGNLD